MKSNLLPLPFLLTLASTLASSGGFDLLSESCDSFLNVDKDGEDEMETGDTGDDEKQT